MSEETTAERISAEFTVEDALAGIRRTLPSPEPSMRPAPAPPGGFATGT